ncbi:hypothetical protein [Zobellia uliginosa]|uniref:hypothetical protein n=1 Tax=Zobellia uliginosa TaxID=143224 RepID=UPI0026E28A6F|nr:hypothetical protein [Zobellia uliginosa]MDO6517353.1 hypothetical protein [Zobellia uliginosa]
MKDSTLPPLSVSEKQHRSNHLSRLYLSLLNEFKRGQTGYATIAIIAQSCIGSAAAMVLLMGNLHDFTKMTLVFFVTILCMAYNASVLAHLKSKFSFNLLLASLLFSCSVIIASFL